MSTKERDAEVIFLDFIPIKTQKSAPKSWSLMSLNSVESNRYAFVDALRALAALLVVWSHANMSFSEGNPNILAKEGWLSAPDSPVSLGTVGVVIFFAISGFLIPSSLKGAKTFLIRRFFRLFPAFWVSLILGTIVMNTWGSHVSLKMFVSNITMIPKALGSSVVLGVYWTLQIELLFYGLCLIFFLLGLIHSLRFLSWMTLSLCILSVLASAIFGKLGVDGISSDTRNMIAYLSIMFWGAVWRKWQEGVPLKFLDKVAIVSIPFCWCIIRPMTGYFLQNINLGLSFCLGIAVFILGTTILKVRWRFISWLGEISYSVYLMHPLIIMPLAWYSGYLKQEPGMFTYVTFSMALTIAFSALSYKLVEKPAIAFGKRISNKVREFYAM